MDAFGVAEPVIQPAGGNRILIQLPGLSQADKESAKKQIQKAAYLEFRMVKEDSDEYVNEKPARFSSRFRRATRCSNTIEPPAQRPARDRSGRREEKGRRTDLAGDIVESAMAVRGNLGEPQIDFRLTVGWRQDGSAKSRATTSASGWPSCWTASCIPRRSSKVAIETGSGQITGHFTPEEAQELANVLQNPLRAPLEH